MPTTKLTPAVGSPLESVILQVTLSRGVITLGFKTKQTKHFIDTNYNLIQITS